MAEEKNKIREQWEALKAEEARLDGAGSKFYLMDETGAWPITDKMREGDLKRLEETFKNITTYSYRPSPKPLPWWIVALAVAAFLGACYIVLKYFSLG